MRLIWRFLVPLPRKLHFLRNGFFSTFCRFSGCGHPLFCRGARFMFSARRFPARGLFPFSARSFSVFSPPGGLFQDGPVSEFFFSLEKPPLPMRRLWPCTFCGFGNSPSLRFLSNCDATLIRGPLPFTGRCENALVPLYARCVYDDSSPLLIYVIALPIAVQCTRTAIFGCRSKAFDDQAMPAFRLLIL